MMNILLVDDDAGSLYGMKFAIEMMGHTCDDCLSPVEAVERYLPARHDVVVLDYHMPGLTGLEALRQMRGKNPELPAIIISGGLVKEPDAALPYILLKKPLGDDFFQVLRELAAGSDNGRPAGS